MEEGDTTVRHAKPWDRPREHQHRSLHRWHFAIGIGAVEGLVVAFLSGAARWIPIALAVVAVILYVTLGRRTRSRTVHDILWVFAFSQALAVIVAVLAFFISWIAYVVAAVLALVVIVMLILDRGGPGREVHA